MVAIEKVKYVPDPNNPNETIAFKEAWVESGLYGLRYGIVKYSSVCFKITKCFTPLGAQSKALALKDSNRIAQKLLRVSIMSYITCIT